MIRPETWSERQGNGGSIFGLLNLMTSLYGGSWIYIMSPQLYRANPTGTIEKTLIRLKESCVPFLNAATLLAHIMRVNSRALSSLCTGRISQVYCTSNPNLLTATRRQQTH